MTTHLLNRISSFIKDSYTSHIRKILLIIVLLGACITWIMISYQKSNIDQRTTNRKAEVKTQYEGQLEEIKQQDNETKKRYEECLEAHKNEPLAPFSLGPCHGVNYVFGGYTVYLDTMLLRDKELKELDVLKERLESGYYWFRMSLLAIFLILIIPTVKLLLIGGRRLKANVKSLRFSIAQMTKFQKYSLTLSLLMFTALVVLILLLLK